MARPPGVEPHGGRRRHPRLYAAAAVLGAVGVVACALIAFFVVWDLATGDWLGLPLDIVFGAVAVLTLASVRRAMRRYR